jgi:hypothetical protein
MKAHGLVIALALVLAAWPAVSQDEDPAERQMRLIEEEESPIIKDVPVEPPGSKRIRVTIEFSETDVHEAIAAVAKIAGVNIRVDPRVKGKVTLTLKDMPWRDALKAVAKAAKAGVVTGKDGTLRVVPAQAVSHHRSTTTWRLVEGKAGILVAGTLAEPKPPLHGKVIKPSDLVPHRTNLQFALIPVRDDPVSKNLRTAIKALRAAGLEKEAKAAEKELARREAARKGLTFIEAVGLTNSIQALRADVAALRKEVRELTALVRELAEKEGK